MHQRSQDSYQKDEFGLRPRKDIQGNDDLDRKPKYLVREPIIPPRTNLDFLDIEFLENNFKQNTKDYLASKGVVFYRRDGSERIDFEKSKEALNEIWLLIEFGEMAKKQLIHYCIDNPFYDLSDSEILEELKTLPDDDLYYRHTLWLFVNLAERLSNFMDFYGMKSRRY